MKFIKSNRGFTLIELLVVIAIIALLSGIIITSLTSSKSKSRDAQRVSDLNQIQLALEQYFDRCGQYPADIYTSTSCSAGVNFTDYISKVPHDPSVGAAYDYAINSATPTTKPATDYILHAKLENSNATQTNSFPDASRTSYAALVSPNNWSTSIGNFKCYDSTTTSKDYCISTK